MVRYSWQWQARVRGVSALTFSLSHTNWAGLHYGSYLQSPEGLKERSQPIFHIHLPSTLTSPDLVAALEQNKNLFTTPFDAYETILDFLLRKNADVRQQGSSGSSLLQRLPSSRSSCASVPGIPLLACELVEYSPSAKASQLIIPNPPSALSFYADIHRENRPALEKLGRQNLTSHLFHDICLCATDRRPWYNCSRHPWEDDKVEPDGLHVPSEIFVMIDCPDAQKIEIQVKPDPQILKRSYITKAQQSGLADVRPNILWIEVDSVSGAYADRHFPQTRELLSTYRLRPQEPSHGDGLDGGSKKIECNSAKWCSAELSRFTVVGPNSIPNQIAAFSGCLVTTGPENCEDMQQKETFFFCNETSHQVYGMQLVGRYRGSQTWCKTAEDVSGNQATSPWLFDIAKTSGYVNLFAEEFCYDGVSYLMRALLDTV